jgi:hypothetical protein
MLSTQFDALVLQWCYRGVTDVLQLCHSGVTVALHETFGGLEVTVESILDSIRPQH